MNSEGANTPPDPPIPMLRLVAAIFPNDRSIRNHGAYPPAVVLYTTG